jgi:hypothetical protein
VVEAGLDDTTAPVPGTTADNGPTPNGETAS